MQREIHSFSNDKTEPRVLGMVNTECSALFIRCVFLLYETIQMI